VAVDARVLVATHRNFEELVKAGTFREDLYHRVYVFPLRVPPLRERREDIPVLVAHFARQLAEQNGWKKKEFTAEGLAALEGYSWPGNVRELRNVVERVLLLATTDTVDVTTVHSALPQIGAGAATGAGQAPLLPTSGTLSERVEAFERQVLMDELRRNNHHMSNTARALGLERSHLYKKCQQLGIDLRELRKSEPIPQDKK
jgi:two-component system nitrogen regulation response regulator NtrX